MILLSRLGQTLPASLGTLASVYPTTPGPPLTDRPHPAFSTYRPPPNSVMVKVPPVSGPGVLMCSDCDTQVRIELSIYFFNYYPPSSSRTTSRW